MPTVKEHAEWAFESINLRLHKWDGADPEWKNNLCEKFYHYVGGAGTDDVVWCTMEVDDTYTLDHIFAPRLYFRALMKYHREVFSNFDLFYPHFLRCMTAVRVTAKQNTDVKYKNYRGRIRVAALTIDKYDTITDGWFHPKHGFVDEFPLKHMIPEFFTQFEKDYMIL
jgi:hypothetical protein